MTSEQILQEAVEKAARSAKAGISTSIDALKRDLADDREKLFADHGQLCEALLEIVRLSTGPKHFGRDLARFIAAGRSGEGLTGLRALKMSHDMERIRQVAGDALDRSNQVAKAAVKALK